MTRVFDSTKIEVQDVAKENGKGNIYIIDLKGETGHTLYKYYNIQEIKRCEYTFKPHSLKGITIVNKVENLEIIKDTPNKLLVF